MSFGWRGRSRPGWVEALAIGLASRAFAVAILVGAWALHFPPSPFTPFANPFVIWDGEWYAFIANYGYHAGAVVQTAYGPGYHDFAFFPAWPMLLRGLTTITGQPNEIVAPIAVNVLFLIAGIAIFAVLERTWDRPIARWGLALFAFSPGAYVYSIAYGEPLFLVFVGLFFLALTWRTSATQTAAATVLTVGAQLVRLTGGALAFASLPDLFDREHRVRAGLVISASLVTFGAWWTWIAILTGDPMGYMLGTPSWFLNQQATPIPVGIASLTYADQWVSGIAVVFIVVLVLGTKWVAQRGQLRMALYCVACLASTMLDTQTTMPRLVAVAFPAFAGLAALAPSARWRWLLLLVSAGMEAALAAYAVTRQITP